MALLIISMLGMPDAYETMHASEYRSATGDLLRRICQRSF